MHRSGMLSSQRTLHLAACLLFCCYLTKGTRFTEQSSTECPGTPRVPCHGRQLILPEFFCVFLGCCVRKTKYGNLCYKKDPLTILPTHISTVPSSPASYIGSRGFRITITPRLTEAPQTTTTIASQLTASASINRKPPKKHSKSKPDELIKLALLTHFFQQSNSTRSVPSFETEKPQAPTYRNKISDGNPYSRNEGGGTNNRDVTTPYVGLIDPPDIADPGMIEPPLPHRRNITDMYTSDERQFLSLVEQELAGFDAESANTSQSLAVREQAVTVAMPTNEFTAGNYSSMQMTRQSRTSTTTTTAQEVDLLPPYTDAPPSGRSIQELNSQFHGRHQPPSEQSIQEIAALLALLEELKRKRETTAATPLRACQLDHRDSCCRVDPTAPCCAFQRGHDLANRAAPTTRIVGGAPAGNLRNSVAHLSKLPHRSHFCGGTVLNNRWILTAAHCTLEYCHRLRQASELLVSLGKYRKGMFLRDLGQQDIPVRDVVCHHNQCRAGDFLPRLNDIALLRLLWPIRFSSTISPALMPEHYESPTPNRNCIVLGFGRTRGSGYNDVLKQVSVPLIPNKQCNRPDWRDCSVRACMMCAGDINIDPCGGDSGGPLFCQRTNGLYVLHGVYSWGRCGTEVRKPAVYTRASHFRGWISRVMQTFPTRT